MNFKYHLHPQVGLELAEGYSWYESKQSGLGKRFLGEVRSKIEKIVNFPDLFGRRGSSQHREARLNRFPYLIIYKINKRRKEVSILSVHHTSQHPSKRYRR